MFSYILFDLDGTISDPKVGITSCVQYALYSMGIDEPDLDKLEPFIGPPLMDSFMQFYGMGQEQAKAAVEKYRERFSAVGKFENQIYPGMAELLRDLQAAGAHLAIASSKPTVYVEDILNYFGIRRYFEIVVGSELDGTRVQKPEILAEVMRRLDAAGAANPDDVVMIGDRRFDIEGAKAVGAHHIAVAYGYAQPGELEAAGAEIVVNSVQGLRQVLLGSAAGWEQTGAAASRTDEINTVQPDKAQTDTDNTAAFQSGTPQPGVFSGSAGNPYRTAKPKKARLRLHAVAMSLLAMGMYFLVSNMVGGLIITAGILFAGQGQIMGVPALSFWANIGNAVAIAAAFAACGGVWGKIVQVRAVKTIDRISLIPMAVLAAALALGMNGVLTLTELYKYSPAFQEVSQLQFETPVWLGILSFGILAPLGEELVFRGLVYGNLKKAFSVPASIIISGLAFGIFHGNLVQGIYASLLGFVLAAVYELYGSIIAPMVFHGIANLVVYVLLDLTPFGGVFVMPLSCIFFMLLSVISLIMMVKWQKQAA